LADEPCKIANWRKAVGKYAKLIAKILSGRKDNDIKFSELVALMKSLGFSLRVTGDHHIFCKNNVPEIINIQPKGAATKPYQVRQVRDLIIKHKLGEEK
jgi:hypothetical protein